MIYAIPICIILGIVMIIGAMNSNSLKNKIDITPTTPINNIKFGQHAELKGNALCEKPLKAPHSDIECVYYSYKVERFERRPNAQGKYSSQWHTIDQGKSNFPFNLKDDTGTVMIDPEGADVDAPIVLKKQLDPDADVEEGSLKAISKTVDMLSKIRQRFELRVIGLNQRLYVLGNVLGDKQEQYYIGEGDEKFLISTKSEEELIRSYEQQSVGLYFLAFAFFVVAIILSVMVYRGS